MSKTIDQKVVEMRFDNRNFENNVRDTMSTLDKLKMKLNFKGASKGLENLNTSASKVNMNGLASALDTCRSRFSTLEIMGVTALANITNSAVNAGKRMVSALTIDPIKTGLSEYETQINAVQTILANTQKEGTNVEIVNKALDELNEYADMTIYNFTEMTRNIGTFTAAGVKLDTSVNAIKGISNLAAISGSTSQQASTAMYQLSQALSSGTVKLMDWNSVVNAGMGGQVFQDALKETARLHGVAIDQMIEDEGSFRDTLQNGWLSSEILTETLEKFTYSAKEGTEEWDKLKKSLMDKGYTEKQATEILKLGNTANEAATKVKTFTQLWDVLKEAAQSGWAQTWRIIIGDFEEAKAFFTPLSDFLTGVINGISKARNELLESALGRKFTAVFDNIRKSADSVKKVVKTVEEYAVVVDEIIGGKWGNTEKRWNALAEAGYDWAHAQNLVNEKLGCSKRYTTDYQEAQNGAAKSQEKVNEMTTDRIIGLMKLTEAELKAKGYTDEQIQAFKDLAEASEKTGIPIKEFIENIDEIDGRFLLINSFKNIGMSLVSVFKSIGAAWRDAFPPMSADTLFNIIAAMHKFTATIRDKVEKNADKLTRTLKGLFAIIDLISMVAGGAFRIAFTLLKTILGAFNLNLLDFTALIGDAIVKFRDWIENNNLIVKGIQKLAEYIKIAVVAVKDWITNNETINKGIDTFKNKLKGFTDSFKSWIEGLKEADNIPKYILQGLVNGLKNGASLVIDTIVNLGKGLLEGIKAILGIHSPSTEFFEIGKNIIQGLCNGLGEFAKMAYTLVMSIGSKIIDIIKNLDIGSIITILTGAGLILGFTKIAKAIDVLAAPLQSLDGLLDQARETLQSFEGVLKAFKFKIIADSIKSIAIAIAILAGSIVVLTMVDQKKMWSAVGAIIALMAVLGGLVALMGKFGGKGGDLKDTFDFGKIALMLVGMGLAVALMAKALKTIATLNPDQAVQGVLGFITLITMLMALMAIVGKAKINTLKLGSTFMSIAGALLVMALVAKIAGKMKQEELIQGGLAIVAFSGIIVGLMAATKLLTGSKNVDKIGKSIIKIAGAILLMAVVAKILGKMDLNELIQGGLAIVAFSGIIVGLMAATKLLTGSKNIAKIGGTIAAIAGAMLLMSLVAVICGNMETGKLIKGGLAIVAFGAIVAGLIWATKFVSGKDLTKVGITILLVSAAIGMLALTAALLSLISVEGLKKGITAVGFLSVFMMGLIAVTKNVPQKIIGTIIVLTAAITLLAIAVGVLSMIDPTKLAAASLSLGLVIGMFALVIKATNSVKKAMGTLIVLTAAIVILAGALYTLAKLPVEQTLSASVALSILVGVLGGIMALLSALSGATGPALLGVLGILALCIPLYAIVDVLSKMQNISNAIENTTVLAAFMGVLAVVQLLCAAAGSIYAATGGMAMLGLVGMVAIIGSLYLVLGALAIMSNIPDAISNLKALTSFMIIMTGVLVALAIVGPLALVGVQALTALTGVMLAIGALAVAIGFLMQKMPALQGFLNTGLSVLVQLAGGIGEMIGAFVNGIFVKISSGLPAIGQNLSLFMTNATPFITGAKMIDGTVVSGVVNLSKAILLLTATDLLNGIASFLTGGTSFARLGTELSSFMNNAHDFIVNSALINPTAMTGIKTLAEAVRILTGADILEGLTSWFTGGNSLEQFGAQLGGLGTNLNQFATNLGTFDESKVVTVDCAGRAISALANAADKIPNEGGWAASILGENSIATFGGYLPGLGSHLSQFVTNLGSFTEAQVTTVDCAGRAVVALADAADKIPNEGGWAAAILGDNSIAKFGQNLPGLGSHLSQFVTNLGTYSDAQVTTVDCAGKAIVALANAADKIPNEGGLWAKIAGDNSLAKFGEKLPGIGSNLNQFIANIGTFAEAQVATVDCASRALVSLAELGKIDIKDTGKNLKSFGEKMINFAGQLKSFTEKVNEVDGSSIDTAIQKTKDLINMAATVASVNIESLKTFGKSLQQVAKEGVKGFVEEFSGSSPKDDAKRATGEMLDSAIDGAEDKKSSVKDKFGDIADAAVGAMKTDSLYSDAKQAGKYLVQGFASGISENTYLATAKAEAMANAAEQAARDALDINSPSRVFRKIGSGVPEGFAQGISMLGSGIKHSVASMSDTAINGTKNAISRIADAINTDIDAQPAIRPVLDLSDIESGAGYLNGMFSNGLTMGVSSNLRAISSGMNAKIQNGTNNDIVSAINKLGKDLSNVGGNTYNVNGVTYDDGSNITEAVRTIVRAATMERRI